MGSREFASLKGRRDAKELLGNLCTEGLKLYTREPQRSHWAGMVLPGRCLSSNPVTECGRFTLGAAALRQHIPIFPS